MLYDLNFMLLKLIHDYYGFKVKWLIFRCVVRNKDLVIDLFNWFVMG